MNYEEIKESIQEAMKLVYKSTNRYQPLKEAQLQELGKLIETFENINKTA